MRNILITTKMSIKKAKLMYDFRKNGQKGNCNEKVQKEYQNEERMTIVAAERDR